MNKEKLNIADKIFYAVKHLLDRITYSKELFEDDIWCIRISKQKNVKSKYSIEQKMFSFSIKNTDDFFKYAFLFGMVVMLAAMLYMSHFVGVSDREIEQNRYSALVYDHFHGTGDPDAYREHPYASMQAQYVDLIIFSVCKSLRVNDVFLVKHFVSSVFGWLLILYLSILILRAYNWRAACFTAFFLFISPRFIGYSLGNVVDATFAFAFIFTLMQMYYFCRELPVIRVYRVVQIVIGALLALSVSNAGFVLMHFLLVFTMLNFLLYNPIKKFYKKEYLAAMLKLFVIVVGITVVVYLLQFFETFFLTKSWVLPRNAFALLGFDTDVAQNQLFKGHLIGPDNFPGNYLIHFMFVSIPSIVLLGALLFVVFFKSAVRSLKPYSVFIFLYAFFYCILKVRNSYLNPDTAMAIYYVIYPLFILIAASGMESTLRSVQDRYTNFVVLCLVALLSFMPIRHVMFNRPYTTLYFNEISGGIHNAYGKYELDFNSRGNRVACNYIKHYVYRNEVGHHFDDQPFVVATNGNEACDYFFRRDPHITVVHQPYNAADTTWDYYIAFCKDVPSAQLRNGSWPQDSTMHRIYVENKPLVAFYKNSYRERQRDIRDSLIQIRRDSLMKANAE